MLVHLLHCPISSTDTVSDGLVAQWASALRAAGVRVRVEVLDPAEPGAESYEDAVAQAAAHVGRLWGSGRKPTVVHTFGVVAAAGALRAGTPAPLVATFHESATVGELEADLAAQVDAVVPLSLQEHRRWERRGVRSVFAAAVPVPVVVPDRHACAKPGGDVVCLATGADLDELLDSMRFWSGRVTILAPMSPSRLAEVRRSLVRLGLTERVSLCPRRSGAASSRIWRGAALVYVGVEDSQHGLPVLEAAAHGVPALARDLGASRDLLVSGTTGLLIGGDPADGGREHDPWTLGHAVASLLAEPFWLRALGTAARVRVSASHSPAVTSTQLGQLYATLLRASGGTAGPPQHAPLPSDERNRLPADRDTLVLEHLPLARQLAGWYSGRGQSSDDLVQVASMGLVRAASRFDPAQGREFHSFAIPTILGELRKHFRDNAWAVRVPRSLQESTMQVQRTAETLSRTIGRPPTVTEVAEHLGVVEEEVRLALRTEGEARFARSLDAPVESDSFVSLIGEDDEALDSIELRRDVHAAIAQLPEREQEILLLRFFGERTQVEISELLGISQVHVSRVLSRTLAAIRDHVMYDVPLPRGGPQGAGRAPRVAAAS